MIVIARSFLVVTFLIFLSFYFLKKEQNAKLNLAIFYSVLYTAISLPILNYILITNGYWQFKDINENLLKIPFDILFIWVIFWGLIPVLFLEKYSIYIILLVVIWIDLLFMPEIDKLGLLHLNQNWLIGELALIVFVLIPAFLWAYCSFYNQNLGFRAIMQILTMVLIFMIGIPYIFKSYGLIENLNFHYSIFEFQTLIIIAFPGLIAVYDLVKIGKGTPFPLDPTKYLVQNGVYAYIQNPIQWSFTILFIWLCFYFCSYWFLIGTIASISYSKSISDFQENEDMTNKFGNDYVVYKSLVPKWYFSWSPKNMPYGQIYFNQNCSQCLSLKKWFESKTLFNLKIKTSSEYTENELFQVTYIDSFGNEFKSVKAISQAFNHINLCYASLGWFMKTPGICQVLQLIIDSMEFKNVDNCKI